MCSFIYRRDARLWYDKPIKSHKLRSNHPMIIAKYKSNVSTGWSIIDRGTQPKFLWICKSKIPKTTKAVNMIYANYYTLFTQNLTRKWKINTYHVHKQKITNKQNANTTRISVFWSHLVTNTPNTNLQAH